MAKTSRRGWRAYMPTIRGGVQIFIALVAIRLVMKGFGATVGWDKVPPVIAQNIPIV